MARISVITNIFENILLWDLDKVQQLREHSVNPPGQERYIAPTDVEALRAQLEVYAQGPVTTSEADAVIANTIGVDDISEATIASASVAQVAQLDAAEIVDPARRQALQDILAYNFVETGNFMLSFDRGVISKMLGLGWIKVFTSDGTALYTL